jgi:anaerobic ribonucleoside-triphosphate reductase
VEKRVPTEIYSRVCGFFRPVKEWNKGKKEEFKDRKCYNIGKDVKFDEKSDYNL